MGAFPLEHSGDWLPRGRTLPAPEWERRHRALLALLWVHVPALTIFALAQGEDPEHALLEGGLIALFALAASSGPLFRRFGSIAVSLGLITCSALLVHIWQGHIEAHFHFFVVISILALYEDWLPFGLAFAYVVAHHGVMGAVAPESVFNHASAVAHPWIWAGVHGFFVACAGGASIVAWRLNEITRARMDHDALHDALTGLPNRVLFADRLALALARARRDGAVDAVMFLDLDGFKVINDSLGHHAGDTVLLEVARRLEVILRSEDTVARFGGDEFTILVEGLASEQAALEIANRVSESLARPLTLGDREIALSASIGVVLTRGGQSGHDLLRDADAAMYRAKEQGRARVELFDEELRDRVVARLDIENSLRLAVERGELRTHYQPKVRVDDGLLVGVEALVRWQHPERGTILPDEFIPLAEETGLILDIGQWVLRDACAQAARWAELLGPERAFPVSVNVSRRQLAHPDLIDSVAAILEETGLAPDQLCLEITESAVMRNLEDSIEILLGLKGLGIRLAIDDFGVGLSSLSQLKHLPPVDMLKIDKSFIDGIAGSGDDRAIVTAILSLASALGVTAIAEGVEHREQAIELSALGCELAQGFHYCRPEPAEALELRFLLEFGVPSRPVARPA